MPSVDAKIWLALKSRIDTLVTNPVMTKIEPGATFEPEGNKPFVLISDARNLVARLGVDARLHERSGTLILSVRWPINQSITHAQLCEIGGQIAEHFPADTRMFFGGVCLRVTTDATMLQPDRDGPWRTVDVRVLWSSV